MEIMKLILDEMHSRQVYLADTYTPPYVCSYAAHCFNLLNQDKKIYWEGKRIPGMRLNVMFIAPPGFMKSFYLDNMGADENCGMFINTGIHFGVEQTLSEAGLIGTFGNFGDKPVELEGAANTYADGIMMIDEFSGVTNAMKATYNNQLDSQLLNILDHGRVNKRLASGKIEYKTRMTLWGGIQPARYDFTSGLGRRVWFMLFLPTKQDNLRLIKIKKLMRNIRVEPEAMTKIRDTIDLWRKSLNIIEHVEFDDEIVDLYEELGVFSYDTGLYDRFLLGYHLAVHGADKEVVITGEDKIAIDMIKQEHRWRSDIIKGIPLVHVERMIAMGGVCNDGEFVMPRKQLIEDALMVGWNSTQMTEMIMEMAKIGTLKIKNGNVHMGC